MKKINIFNKLVYILVLINLGFGQTPSIMSETLKIKSEFNEGRLTIEEASTRLRELGVPASTIEQYENSLELDQNKNMNIFPNELDPILIDSRIIENVISEDTLDYTFNKVEIENRDNYFGYRFFNNVPTSFKLDQIGPVDPDYRIGPGDEIKIHMWGESEYYQSKVVSRDGAIYIDKIGQIIVNGLTLDGLNTKLMNAMSKVYYTLKSHGNEDATTFLFVTLGNLKPITIYFLGDAKKIGAFKVDSYSTAFTALYFAGGPSTDGSLRNIQVIRSGDVVANLDLYEYLTSGQNLNDIRIQHNDHIFIPPRGKTVSVSGEVKNPLIFELLENETLADLIQFTGGLTVQADIDRVQIKRIRDFSSRVVLSDTTSNKILIDESLSMKNKDGKIEIIGHQLFDGDKINIFQLVGEQKGFVEINGAIYRPGSYALSKNSTFSDLVKNCDGFKPDVSLEKAELIRTLPNDSTLYIEFKLNSENFSNIKLKDKDKIFIYSIWDLQQKLSVEIKGNIKAPGKYELHKGMTLYDLLYKTTLINDPRFLKTIYDKITIIRYDDDYAQNQEIHVSFKEVISRKKTVKLKNEDIVLVKEQKEMGRNFINISGEIKYPGVYYYERGKTLKKIIQTAGGLTSNSFMFGAEYFRNSEKIAINILEYSKDNYEIELGVNDSLVIPQNPNVVEIVGFVRNQSSIIYQPDWNIYDYINASGGLLDNSDKSSIYVIYPDGTTRVKKWIFNPKLEEGCVIVVPEKIEEEDIGTREFFKEITAILSNLATIIFVLNK